MSRNGVSATAWILRATATATLSLAIVACGGGSSADEEADAGAPPSSSEPASASSSSTSVLPAAGTPFPDGVYQGSLTADDWTAQGLPSDTDADVDFHVITFTGGTVYDIAIHADGSREPGGQWTYVVTGDHEITLTDLSDTSRTVTMGWELSENQMSFTMEPDQGEPEDRVLWTSHPLAKVG